MKYILLILLLEIIVRVIKYSDVKETPLVQNSTLWNESVDLKGFLQPSSFSIARYSMTPYIVHGNNLGFRNSEDLNLIKPNNEYRILMLGDSFTYAEFCNQDETYPEVLQRTLRESFPNKNIKVVNSGKPGAGPLLEYNFYKNAGVFLNPDLVVINFHANDIDDVLGEYQISSYRKELEHQPKLIKLKNILRNSAIYQTLLEYFVKYSVSKKENKTNEQNIPVLEKKADLYQKTMDNILNLAKAHHQKVLIVITPRAYDAEKTLIDNDKIALTYAQNHHLIYVDTLPLMSQKISELERSLVPINRHLSRIGNKYLANVVADKILKENFIK